MQSYPALRRVLSAGLTVAVLAGVAVALALGNRSRPEAEAKDKDKPAANLKDYPWPMWGGQLSRNMVNTRERNVPVKFGFDDDGKKFNILWEADLGSKAYAGPVIADGKIFVGTNNQKPRDKKYLDPKGKPIDLGVLMCFNQADGKFLWQRIHHKLPSGIVSDWPREGICSTPVVEGKRLWYVSNRSEVVCCTTDGKDVWSVDMMKELGTFTHNLATSSPLLVGDLLFVITSNGVDEGHINVPAPQAPSFIAVEKDTGKVVWQNNLPSVNLLKLAPPEGSEKEAFIKRLVNSGKLLMHGQWSSPAYAVANGRPQVIFPGGDGWLRGFDPKTGDLLWSFDGNPKKSFYALAAKGTRNDFISTPAVYDNKVYIGLGQDPEHEEGISHFWCIDITKKGDVSPVNDNFDPKAPENKNSALVWHYGEPSKEPRIPGRKNYTFGRTISTAAVHDGLVYISEMAGYLHCLDAQTGKRYWYHYLGKSIWSSPFWVDGKVYMGTDGGKVFVFAHGKEKRILAENDMAGEENTKVRATPVVADGVLYIQTENRLYAIKEGKGG
jgi:outer membrane protein assembly factor BamB